MRVHVHEEPFEAPPERLFALLHTPSAIRAWWGASRAIVMPEAGGTWAAAWGGAEDDPDYVTVATVRTFEPPRRLVLGDYRYRAREGALPFEAAFETTFEVIPHGGGSVLRVSQAGFPEGPEADAFLAACDRGWRDTFAGIRRQLAGAGSPTPLLTDLALARRLERAEGTANAAFVESRARLSPTTGATWQDVDGTYAMFDGVGSPLTQTFGLGLWQPASAEGLASIEAFFGARGAATDHEVCPLADAALLRLLPERGYRPVEQSSVLVQSLAGAGEIPASAVQVREAPDLAQWAEIAAEGWGGTPELAAFIREFGLVLGRARGVTCFLAELDGRPIATATLSLHDGVALLAGASTIPAWRGRGAQQALLAARLAHAAAHGASLAMMVASPGSTSQTNAERRGFRMAYTRTKWRRPTGS